VHGAGEGDAEAPEPAEDGGHEHQDAEAPESESDGGRHH
jgi:hypothetical protein